MANETWEYETAYKLVELYVTELVERRDKKILDLEGIVEAYLYVLSRLRTGEAELKKISKEIKKQLKENPPKSGETGVSEALGKKRLNAGLLKALEGL